MPTKPGSHTGSHSHTAHEKEKEKDDKETSANIATIKEEVKKLVREEVAKQLAELKKIQNPSGPVTPAQEAMGPPPPEKPHMNW